MLERGSEFPRRRHLAALVVHAALGVIGGVLIAVLGPWATGIVFGASVAAQPVPSGLYAVAFFCISLATPMIRNLLIPAGRFRIVLVATVSAALAGLTIMISGAQAGSAVVIAAGVAVSELTALLVLAPAAAHEFRRLSLESH